MFGLIIKSAVRREARAVPTWLHPVRGDICARGRMERSGRPRGRGLRGRTSLSPICDMVGFQVRIQWGVQCRGDKEGTLLVW